MKNAIIEELAGTWEVMAETEDGSNPQRRKTLRECADTLRMLLSSEGLNAREQEMEDLLRSACAIAERKGASTAWDRFANSIRKLGLNSVTARTYRILPSDIEGTATSQTGTANTAQASQADASEVRDAAPVISSYDLEKVKSLKYKFVEELIHNGVQYRTCGAISATLNQIIDDSEKFALRTNPATPASKPNDQE